MANRATRQKPPTRSSSRMPPAAASRPCFSLGNLVRSETLKEMPRASKELHGEPCHPTEAANTIVFPDAPGGCIAAMLFTWKFSPVHMIVHEVSHAAVACVVKIGPGLSPDEDEPLAMFNEKIFRAIFRRIHA